MTVKEEKFKKKKPSGFNKLTPFEKEALLYAMLQHHDPSIAIENMLENVESHHIRWDGYQKNIIPSLRTILKKLDSKTVNSWIQPQTKLSEIRDLITELDLLAKNDRISFRGKGIGALLILEFYIDRNLQRDPEAQKKLIHDYSLLKTNSIYDLYGELKSTVTKALMELGNHPAANPYMLSEDHEKWKQELVLRNNLDVAAANNLLDFLRDDTISWQAKGLFLYLYIYDTIHPTFINVFNPNSSIEKGWAELENKGLLGSNEAG